MHSDCLAVVQAPTVRVEPQLTLPLDINNYLMTHFVRAIFRVGSTLPLLRGKHLQCIL